MIVVLISASAVVLACVALLVYLLKTERDRVSTLLTLLESKAAPAEYAAYNTTTPVMEHDSSDWIFSADGLVGAQRDDG